MALTPKSSVAWRILNEHDDKREDKEPKLRHEQHGGTQKVEKKTAAEVEKTQFIAITSSADGN